MATNRNTQVVSIQASEDLTAAQYRIVQVTGGGSCGLATAATNIVVGVTQNKGTTGDGMRIAVGGVSKLEAGAAVTAGSLVVAVAGGRGSQAALNTGTHYIGVALTGADGSASLFDVLIDPRSA